MDATHCYVVSPLMLAPPRGCRLVNDAINDLPPLSILLKSCRRFDGHLMTVIDIILNHSACARALAAVIYLV